MSRYQPRPVRTLRRPARRGDSPEMAEFQRLTAKATPEHLTPWPDLPPDHPARVTAEHKVNVAALGKAAVEQFAAKREGRPVAAAAARVLAANERRTRLYARAAAAAWWRTALPACGASPARSDTETGQTLPPALADHATEHGPPEPERDIEPPQRLRDAVLTRAVLTAAPPRSLCQSGSALPARH